MLTPEQIKQMDAITGFSTPATQGTGSTRISELQELVAQEDGNIGTGFEPAREFEPREPIKNIGRTLLNIPRSGKELVKAVGGAITHPKRTVKAVVSAVKGAGEAIGEAALEKTEFGRRFLEMANQRRIEQGLPELQRDAQGNLQAEGTQDLETAKQIGAFFKERYGGIENVKESVVEDPVGVLADVAAVVSGAGAAVKGAGTVSRVGRVSQVGEAITKAGQALEPLSVAGKAASQSISFLSKFRPKKGGAISEIASDVAPFSRSAITEGGVVKALDLTPGDVSTFEKLTGNKLSDFVLKETRANTQKGLLRDLEELKIVSKDQVRSLIDGVEKTYTGDQVVRVTQTLDMLEDVYKSLPAGNEDIIKQIQDLKAKGTYTLNDFQTTKELLDDSFGNKIFDKTGGVKDSARARGAANIRRDIKTFIEDEVSANIGGDKGNVIKELNNKVQSSFELEEMVLKRAAKDLTRQGATVFELLLGVGGFSQFGVSGALGVLAAKKLTESPAFRLSLARAVSSLNKGVVKDLAKQAKSGKFTEESLKVLDALKEEAAANAQFIESGAQGLRSATEDGDQ